MKITVVIPTFNREKVLSKAVESVIRQTHENWELYIVDDGSEDCTKEIVKKKYTKDHRVNLLERPHHRLKGANACRNIGIEKSSGKYIALLDSDDEWKEHHLKRCLEFAEQKSNFSGSFSGAIIKKGDHIKKRSSRKIKPGETHVDYLLSNGFAQTSTYFVNRKKAQKIKFDEGLHRHQDWDFFIRFGREYSWEYNEEYSVIFTSGADNIERIDFSSCIEFFERHKENISNENYLINYISSMYKKALIMNDDSAIKCYGEILRDYDNSLKYSDEFKFIYKLYLTAKYKFPLKKHHLKNKFNM